jgi:hypothetical protein
MERRLRTAGFVALLLAAAALAYAGLERAGFVGEDLSYLVRASRSAGSEAAVLAERLSEGDGPLARLSLALSFRLWARDGTWSAGAVRFLRLENLLLLLGTAACARLALRRALSTWAGMDGARAAAGACALLLVCHPLCIPAVAAAGARGDLLAAFFCAATAALFLRGRQEKRVPEMAAAAVCALLAGHSSALGLLLPPWLFGLEVFCARRHRPLSVRLRTAATTLLVFGACAASESLSGPALGSPALLPRTLHSVSALLETGGARAVLRSVATGLGAVSLPVPRAAPWDHSAPGGPDGIVGMGGMGSLGYVIAGALLLAALQPALVAARSAPRLWGWLAAFTCAGVLLPLLLRAPAAQEASGLASRLGLFQAAIVACAGLAVASTALSGVRRVLIPASLAAAFAVFARSAAAPWKEAGRELGELQADLGAARALHGGGARYLLVDPPGHAAGLDVEGQALPLLLDPSLCAQAQRGDKASVGAISRGALVAFSREPEFEEMRRQGLVLLQPPSEPGARRAAVALPAPHASNGSLSWREDLRSPLFDVDPLEKRALRANALPRAETAEAPRMGWRAGEADTGSQTGIWIEGPNGPIALFDLSRSPAWLFGSRVHRVWLEPEIGRIPSAELQSDVPALAAILEPQLQGNRWAFQIPARERPRPLRGDAHFVLALLELASLRYLEVPAQPASEGDRGGEVGFVLEAGIPLQGSPLAWSLELRAGDVCIARATGRR